MCLLPSASRSGKKEPNMKKEQQSKIKDLFYQNTHLCRLICISFGFLQATCARRLIDSAVQIRSIRGEEKRTACWGNVSQSCFYRDFLSLLKSIWRLHVQEHRPMTWPALSNNEAHRWVALSSKSALCWLRLGWHWASSVLPCSVITLSGRHSSNEFILTPTDMVSY